VKTQSYNNFWQRIHKSAKNRGFPLRVMFELTYRCNFNCRHCYVPQSYREYRELKTKEVFSVLDQLADIGCFYLGFTGGEPFLRKDIMKILWYAKRKGFEIIIYTNGSLIDEKIAEELAHLRPNKVDITIPAMTEDAFERITEAEGSHKKVFKAIEILHKKGVELGFKTCVLKENENEIKDIQDFAASLDAMHRLDDMLSPCLDGSGEPYKYRGSLDSLGSLSSFRPFSSLDKECSLSTKPPTTENQTLNTENLFKCGVGISQAAITPFGELKMCLMIDYPKYNILDTEHRTPNTEHRTQRANLKDAWERLKELVASIKPDKDYKCNRCELEPYCKWCPARGWLEDRNFTSCEPQSRTLAEIRSQKSEDRDRASKTENLLPKTQNR